MSYLCSVKKSFVLFFLFASLIWCACRFSAQGNEISPEEGRALFSKEYIPAFIKDSFYLNDANPFSKEKAALGRYFFYDTRLSVNNTKSCASCHAPQFSFTDNYVRSIGALGDLHQRNARPLINIVFNKYLTAADSTLHFPEEQMNNPMMSEHPVEMGMKGHEQTIIAGIKADAFYRRELPRLFPKEDDPFTIRNIQYCIASFVRTIISFSSTYDQYLQGDKHALSASQISGMQLFFSDSLRCGSCHGGINFSAPSADGKDAFFNTDLYSLDKSGAYPSLDQGLFERTKNPKDMGRYRSPTLRNLFFTAPYYHDGSAVSLEEVILNYEAGGRRTDNGINKGDGRQNPLKDKRITGFRLTSQQRRDLINFLFSLTDSAVTKNPAYADPFKR